MRTPQFDQSVSHRCPIAMDVDDAELSGDSDVSEIEPRSGLLRHSTLTRFDDYEEACGGGDSGGLSATTTLSSVKTRSPIEK